MKIATAEFAKITNARKIAALGQRMHAKTATAGASFTQGGYMIRLVVYQITATWELSVHQVVWAIAIKLVEMEKFKPAKEIRIVLRKIRERLIHASLFRQKAQQNINAGLTEALNRDGQKQTQAINVVPAEHPATTKARQELAEDRLRVVARLPEVEDKPQVVVGKLPEVEDRLRAVAVVAHRSLL